MGMPIGNLNREFRIGIAIGNGNREWLSGIAIKNSYLIKVPTNKITFCFILSVCKLQILHIIVFASLFLSVSSTVGKQISFLIL